MEIIIKDLQVKVPLNPPQIRKITKTILRHEGIDNAVLSVVFVSYQRIKSLNKKYLARNHATDVLAFDLRDNVPSKPKSRQRPKILVGDIFISTDAALKNAQMYKTTLAQELSLYIIHGLLHLLGFDDHQVIEIKKIRKKEQEILLLLGAQVKHIVRKKGH